jgi:hypothetical protein
MGFEWFDYRGGALSDSSSKDDVQALVKQVKQSDCLLLCISAEHLQIKEKMKRDRAIKASKMNVLMTEIGKAVKPTANKPFPVAIVITKFDQYPKSNDPQQVIEAIKEIFPTFWTSPGWIVSVCPVTLGKALGENFDEGEIDPVNVHIPVSFAIYCKLYTQKIQEKIRLQELKNKTGQLKDQLDNLKSKNPFVRMWKGNEIDSTSSSIEKTAKELEKANQGLDETTKKLNLLSEEMMQTCFIYLNGEEGGFND